MVSPSVSGAPSLESSEGEEITKKWLHVCLILTWNENAERNKELIVPLQPSCNLSISPQNTPSPITILQKWPSVTATQSQFLHPQSLHDRGSSCRQVPPNRLWQKSSVGKTVSRRLTDNERLQICLYHIENHTTRHEDIGGNPYLSPGMHSSATVGWQMILDSNVWSWTEVKLTSKRIKQLYLSNDTKYNFKGSTPKGQVSEVWEKTHSSYTGWKMPSHCFE